MTTADKVILALDVNDSGHALDLVEITGKYVTIFKVGFELFLSSGHRIIEKIHGKGKKVFLDLKFHDIPNTVEKVSAEVTRLGVHMFTVHASGGYDMMRRCSDRVVNLCLKENLTKPKIIGVTVLTSISDKSFREELGCQHSIATHVKHLASLARRSGLDGVVASGQEVSLIRNYSEKNFLILSPGIRPPWSPPDDQKRTMTPKEALRNGADYLVIGRAITGHDNPLRAVELIIREISGYE